jgi:cell division protein FtsQ
MQQVWRKRLRVTAWIALAATTLVLLISAVYKKNHKACKEVEVTFTGEGTNFFIEEKGVIELLKSNGLVIGQPVEEIDLRGLEDILKKDPWIANADLFFDNNQALQAIVEEKTPVARIFTTAGSSFYIDSACNRLPLSERLTARVPMFSNFPSDKLNLSRPDSQLLSSAKELAMFIQKDVFWKSQVAQIDITPDGFEMIPTLGSHVVLLGAGSDLQRKFDRLYSFYKQVWVKVGFEKYEKLDVRFNGQVVATVKGAKKPVVDSEKASIAYEKLLNETTREQEPAEERLAVVDRQAKSQERIASVKVRERTVSVSKKDAELLVKSTASKEEANKRFLNNQSNSKKPETEAVSKAVASDGSAEGRRVPKAIMRKPITP